MTQVFTYTKPNKLSLLHDQLIAAGLGPLRAEGIGDLITLTYPDGQSQSPVTAVVNAHDPAVLSVGEQAAQQLATDRDDLGTQYAAMTTRLDGVVTDGATYTAAQVRDAVVDLSRIVRRVLRLVKSSRI